MNNIKIKNYCCLIIGLAIATWMILIFIYEGSLSFTYNAFLQIPKVVTVNALIWFLFIKWCWKWKLFRGWLVPFPDLSGNWQGQAIPKNINPNTGQSYEPVDLRATIKQTFLAIHVRIYSQEMESNSYSASFKLDGETDEKRLCYSYLSKPRANIRDRSPIHDGTALLTIKGDEENGLEGEYWTNRATTGELYLQHLIKQK